MKRFLFALLVAGLPSYASAVETPVSGERGSLTLPTIACREPADFSRVKSLMNAGDALALLRFAQARRPACRLVEQAEGFTVEEVSVWNAGLCVRGEADRACLWVPIDRARKL